LSEKKPPKNKKGGDGKEICVARGVGGRVYDPLATRPNQGTGFCYIPDEKRKRYGVSVDDCRGRGRDSTNNRGL